jgi:hypothetical protein
MSIHRISHRHSGPSAQGTRAAPVARGLSLDPLWMVTFAAGLPFGMLAVLLTSG